MTDHHQKLEPMPPPQPPQRWRVMAYDKKNDQVGLVWRDVTGWVGKDGILFMDQADGKRTMLAVANYSRVTAIPLND